MFETTVLHVEVINNNKQIVTLSVLLSYIHVIDKCQLDSDLPDT